VSAKARERPGKFHMTFAAWLFAVLAFAAVVAIVGQRGEIAETITLIRGVQTRWLLLAAGLEGLTYVMAAAVWHLALEANHHHQSMRSLMALVLAMLVSNQAVPSVGVSGGLVVVEALVRRGVPEAAVMSALLLGLVSAYAAFLTALAVVGFWMRPSHGAHTLMVGATIAFTLMAGAVTSAVFGVGRLPQVWRRRLSRWPVVGASVEGLADAQTAPLREPRLFFKATAFQLAEIAIDTSTFGVVLYALGFHLPAQVVFGTYVIASVTSRVALVPLGLGTFEAASVTVLHASGVPVGAALAATLIFRGFTLWLPMLPGLVAARRVLQPYRGRGQSRTIFRRRAGGRGRAGR
jgi:uncharacterized membrane protein YbhN (UPF0104 family)